LALEDGELMPEGEDLRQEVEARPKAQPEGGLSLPETPSAQEGRPICAMSVAKTQLPEP
jgi:hypothetical protein